MDMLRYILLNKFEVAIIHQVLNIGNIACNEIIQANYGVPFGEQEITQVQADKTGTTGDKYIYCPTPM